MKKIDFFFIFLFVACSNSVDTIQPVRKNIIETVYASGKIIAEDEYTVYALSSGTIKEKLVHEGDAVANNEVLYKIMNDAPAAKLEAAKSNFENVQSNLSPRSHLLNDLVLAMQSAKAKFSNDSIQYERLRNLFFQNAASQSSVDNAQTAYVISKNQKSSAEEKYFIALNDLKVSMKNAKSQLTGAQTELDYYSIKSESGGTVFQTYKEKGEAVKPGEPVALLGKTSQRIIRLAVDQQDISKINIGQEVLLKTDVTANTIFHAKIIRIYPVMNEADQTFRVDAIFTDSISQLYIHSSVEANIIVGKKDQALLVPRKALFDKDSVYVKQGGKIKAVAVETGIQSLDETEILKGLDESSVVVIPSEK